MKKLHHHTFDALNGRQEWTEYSRLLYSKPVLNEQKDILPFFKTRHDLSVLISNYFPKIMAPDRFAHEFQIYGDFVADLIVGNSAVHRYVLVEFEDGAPDSIFKQKSNKSTPDWAPRFERAYSQLVDWLWKLEDMRSTADFVHTFGSRQASFQGLIVIGKEMNLTPQEENRLKWRMDRTMIDSNAISVVSFNELSDNLNDWLKRYYGV